MPDLTTHATTTNVILGASFYSGVYPSETATPAVALAFVVGSLIPDVGNLGYFALGKIRGRGMGILPATWRNARSCRWIDRHTWWGWPYKFTHSITGCVITTMFVWIIAGAPAAIGYAAGCIMHLALDVPTHEDVWLCWPIRSFRIPVPNWWKLALYRRGHANMLSAHITGVSVNAAIAWFIVYGMPL